MKLLDRFLSIYQCDELIEEALFQRLFFAIVCYWLCVAVISYLIPYSLINIALFFTMLCSIMLMIIVGIRLIRLQSAPVHPVWFGLGIIFILASAMFELSASLTYRQHVNIIYQPFIRLVFSKSASLQMIFLCAIIKQLLYLIALGVLWTLFLRIYPSLIANAAQSNFRQTITRLIGGDNKGDYQYPILAIISMMLGLCVYQWFNYLPYGRNTALMISLGALGVYILLSYRLIRFNSRNA